MSWKKRVAKEWLWLICTVVGGMFMWSILISFDPDHSFSYYWDSLFELDEGLFLTIGSTAGAYLIRLTVWSIKQI